jgi:hypothetical protein
MSFLFSNGGICKSSRRKARKALNPKILPIVEVNKLVTKPSSNKSWSYNRFFW